MLETPRSQNHSKTRKHGVLSLLLTGCHLRLTTRTSGSHGNWEEVYSVTSSLEMPHSDAHLFFFPMQEPGASHGRRGEQGESKGRCCLIQGMGNPGHSLPQGTADAKILPEFRETREIHGLKNHQVLFSAMAVLQRDAQAACRGAGRVCWGLCTPWAPALATYLPTGRKASPWHRSEVQLRSSKPVR